MSAPKDRSIHYALENGFFEFDFEEGMIFRVKTPSGRPIEKKIATNTVDKSGYPLVRIAMPGHSPRYVFAHRLIYAAAHGPISPGLVIDHINHDKKDFRIRNLRAVTQLENCLNRNEDNYEPLPATKDFIDDVMEEWLVGKSCHAIAIERFGNASRGGALLSMMRALDAVGYRPGSFTHDEAA